MGHLCLGFSSAESCIVDGQDRNGLKDIFVGDDPDTLVAVAVNTPLVNLNFAKPRDSPKVVLHGGLAGGVTDDAVVDLDAPNVN